MTNAQKTSSCALSKSDIELIVYKAADMIVTSIAYSFVRLEKRIDAAESRLCAKPNDLSEEIATAATEASVNSLIKPS